MSSATLPTITTLFFFSLSTYIAPVVHLCRTWLQSRSFSNALWIFLWVSLCRAVPRQKFKLILCELMNDNIFVYFLLEFVELLVSVQCAQNQQFKWLVFCQCCIPSLLFYARRVITFFDVHKYQIKLAGKSVIQLY